MSVWGADRLASRRAMAFLELGAGPRAYALGEAFAGLADDVNTLSWNPAGLGQVNDTQILFQHNQWIVNLRQEYLSAAVPQAWGCPAVQVSYLNSDIQERRDEDGLVTGNGFNPYSALVGLAYGRNLGQGFLAGVLLNYAREQLDDVTYSSVCLDAGALYRPAGAWYSAGAALQNLGTPVAGFPTPLTLRAGLAGRFFQDQLIVSADVSRPWLGWFRYGVGVEYWYQNLFALRAGYLWRPENEGLDNLSGLRAGLGFNLQGYQLDYALIPQGDLGFGHRASFTYFFGGGRALASEREKLIAEARATGRTALKAGQYTQAVDAFQKVLTFAPEDATALAGLGGARTALKRQELEQEINLHFVKADQFRKNGQLSDALEEYQRVLLLDEKNTRAAKALGETREAYHAKTIAKNLAEGRKAFTLRDWADALLAYQNVLELDPNQAEAKEMLDKIRVEMVKGGQGFKDPRIKEYYLAGLKKFEQGDYRGAMEAWGKLLKIEPKHREARQYMQLAGKLLEEKVADLIAAGSRYLQAGDLVRAAGNWRRILAISPQYVEVLKLIQANDGVFKQRAKEYYLKGIEQYTQGLWKQAIANWRDTLTLVPDYPGAADNIDKTQKKLKAVQ
ncbi:MAG: PorV/PorQ family protein [Candidatus Firestonebacteria bacterium]|nr:PorV/PorQ family protein [Candidatus Firestonebacteria bacterium]